MRNTGLNEAQAGIKIAGRNINNLSYADDTTFMAESEEELKSFLMKVKEKSEKVGLKLNIQKTEIMTSSPITSWQIDRETVETVSDLIWGGSKITADGDYSHEIKRHLLLGRKVMTNLDSLLRSRDITLPTKIHLVKAMVFPVVVYGCKSRPIKKAECQKIDAFEVWCWRRLLRVPWTARRSDQSILKEMSPEYSLEGLMLKLKLQYFGHLMWRADSFEKTLMLGKIKGRRRRGWQRMRWLDGITDSMDLSLGKLQVGDGEGDLVCCGSWRHRVRHWVTELNWTVSSFRWVDSGLQGEDWSDLPSWKVHLDTLPWDLYAVRQAQAVQERARVSVASTAANWAHWPAHGWCPYSLCGDWKRNQERDCSGQEGWVCDLLCLYDITMCLCLTPFPASNQVTLFHFTCVLWSCSFSFCFFSMCCRLLAQ